jgi:WD40 repeat protein
MRVQWIVGDTEGSTSSAGRYGDTWVTSLQAATKAPIAASISAVASGRQSSSIQLWDTKNWKEIAVPALEVEIFPTWPWSAAALSSDGHLVVVSSQDCARAINPGTGNVCWETKPSGSDGGSKKIKQLAFIQDDRLLAVAFQNSLELWDAQTGKMSKELAVAGPEISLMKASRDGKFLAVVGDKKKVTVWNVEKHSVVRESTTDPDYIYAIEFSPDGNQLAISGASCRDGFVLWDLKTGSKTKIPARGAEISEEVVALAWSPDGKTFAAEPQGQAVLIYDAQTWKPLVRWRIPTVGGGTSAHLSFASDGTLLARLQDGSLRGLNVFKTEKSQAR